MKHTSILLILTLVLASCGKSSNIVNREVTPPVTPVEEQLEEQLEEWKKQEEELNQRKEEWKKKQEKEKDPCETMYSLILNSTPVKAMLNTELGEAVVNSEVGRVVAVVAENEEVKKAILLELGKTMVGAGVGLVKGAAKVTVKVTVKVAWRVAKGVVYMWGRFVIRPRGSANVARN